MLSGLGDLELVHLERGSKGRETRGTRDSTSGCGVSVGHAHRSARCSPSSSFPLRVFVSVRTLHGLSHMMTKTFLRHREACRGEGCSSSLHCTRAQNQATRATHSADQTTKQLANLDHAGASGCAPLVAGQCGGVVCGVRGVCAACVCVVLTSSRSMDWYSMAVPVASGTFASSEYSEAMVGKGGRGSGKQTAADQTRRASTKRADERRRPKRRAERARALPVARARLLVFHPR